MTLKRTTKRLDLTHVAVEVSTMGSSENAYEATFIIDINFFESIAPASELRKVGIEPQGKRAYELPTGEVLEYEYAFVELRFLDEINTTRILFGPDDAAPCLGRLALNAAGFIVDLKTETITKLSARPLKKAAKIALAR